MLRILFIIFVEIPWFLFVGWLEPRDDKGNFNFTNPTRLKPVLQVIMVLLVSAFFHYIIMESSGYTELSSADFYYLQDHAFGNLMTAIYVNGFAFWKGYFALVNPIWIHGWNWAFGSVMSETVANILSFVLITAVFAGIVFVPTNRINKAYNFKLFNIVGVVFGVFTAIYFHILAYTLHFMYLNDGNEIQGHLYFALVFTILSYAFQIIPYFRAKKYQELMIIHKDGAWEYLMRKDMERREKEQKQAERKNKIKSKTTA